MCGKIRNSERGDCSRPAVPGRAYARIGRQGRGGGAYFAPRWRDFLLRQGFRERVEGFSLRSKIKVGLDAKGGGFKLLA